MQAPRQRAASGGSRRGTAGTRPCRSSGSRTQMPRAFPAGHARPHGAAPPYSPPTASPCSRREPIRMIGAVMPMASQLGRRLTRALSDDSESENAPDSLVCRVFEPAHSDQVALGHRPVETSSRWDSVPLARPGSDNAPQGLSLVQACLVATWSRCAAHSQASQRDRVPTRLGRCSPENAPARAGLSFRRIRRRPDAGSGPSDRTNPRRRGTGGRWPPRWAGPAASSACPSRIPSPFRPGRSPG